MTKFNNFFRIFGKKIRKFFPFFSVAPPSASQNFLAVRLSLRSYGNPFHTVFHSLFGILCLSGIAESDQASLLTYDNPKYRKIPLYSPVANRRGLFAISAASAALVIKPSSTSVAGIDVARRT